MNLASRAPAAPRRRPGALARREAAAGWLFAAPWVFGSLGLFTLVPLVAAGYISLTEYEVLRPPTFVGLENYREAFAQDPKFWASAANTLWMALTYVPLNVVLSLVLALLLNQRIRGIGVYRTLWYVPAIVPGVSSALLFLFLLNPEIGLVNAGLEAVGVEGPSWLGDPAWSKPAILIMLLWGAGSTTLVYLAGLQGIDEQLYEAARIDGAGSWMQFWRITLPLVTPALFFGLTTGMIGIAQIFAPAYVLTQGGPAGSTLFYVYHLFNNAFRFYRYGYAAALGWILLVFVVVLTAVNFALARRWVYYEARE